MRSVKNLIESAVKECGGPSALATRIGVKPPDISQMVHGKRPITPETVAALAEVLTLSPSEAQRLACAAVCENPKNSNKEGMLRRVFGLPKRAGQAVKTMAPLDVTGHWRKLVRIVPWRR